MLRTIFWLIIIITFSSCSSSIDEKQKKLTIIKSSKIDSIDNKLFDEFIKIPNSEWELIQPIWGSCYFDTIFSAIWIRVIPDQVINKFSVDSSFIIARAEIVNKSPVDIYLYGQNNTLRVAVTKEWTEKDTTPETDFITSAGSFKFMKEIAFTREDYKRNPFRELWRLRNKDIKIATGTREVVQFSIPKRDGIFRISMEVAFNIEDYWYDCKGAKVSHTQEIESNKFELSKNLN